MSSDDLTRAVAKLTEVFGSASQNTLGSAVFQSDSKVDLETLDNYAKSVYQHFVGKAWDFGPENWNKTWQMLYRRPEGSTGSILEELKSLGDAATELAASQVTENHDDPTAATQGLTGVFDSPSLTSVSVYRIGDSEAITGVLVAGLMPTENAIALVFLMD
ncbi:MAG: hypothetical protein ACK48K_14555 [Planctomycetota bacterium]